MEVLYREMGDPEGPGIPGYFQNLGGCSVKGGAAGSLYTKVGPSWVGLDKDRKEHSLLCR